MKPTPKRSNRQPYFVVLIFMTLLLNACIGPKRIDKWVAMHYNQVPLPVKKKSDLVNIQSTLPTTGNKLSETTKKKGSLLPLIVYWKWTYGNTCNLNPQMGINHFTTTVMNQATRSLKQKLNGQTLELTLEKLPATFDLDDTGHAIFVLLYVFSWEKVKIQPQDKELLVSYKVYDSNRVVTKTGRVVVPVTQTAVNVGLYKSVKKKTWHYLEQHDASIIAMSKTVVEKIAAEL